VCSLFRNGVKFTRGYKKSPSGPIYQRCKHAKLFYLSLACSSFPAKVDRPVEFDGKVCISPRKSQAMHVHNFNKVDQLYRNQLGVLFFWGKVGGV
jgi:hypothetical protein